MIKRTHDNLYLIIKKGHEYIIYHMLLCSKYCTKIHNLLHWDVKLDSVRRLLFSWPHQFEKPFRSEDSKLRVAQLVERVAAEIRVCVLHYNENLLTKVAHTQQFIKHSVVMFCSPQNVFKPFYRLSIPLGVEIFSILHFGIKW